MTGGGRDKGVVISAVSEHTCRMMKEELSFFPYLEGADFADVPCFFEKHTLEPGEVLFEEGESCAFLAYIIEGSLEHATEETCRGLKTFEVIYEGTEVGLMMSDAEDSALATRGFS